MLRTKNGHFWQFVNFYHALHGSDGTCLHLRLLYAMEKREGDRDISYSDDRVTNLDLSIPFPRIFSTPSLTKFPSCISFWVTTSPQSYLWIEYLQSRVEAVGKGDGEPQRAGLALDGDLPVETETCRPPCGMIRE